MSQLKLTTQSLHAVDHIELERFVTESYGTPYSAIIALECGNHTAHLITPDDILDDCDRDKISKWIDSGREGLSPEPRIILSDLLRRRMIPEGDYQINVCW